MKFVKPLSTQEQIYKNINHIKQQHKERQYPSKHAPMINELDLIILSGCTFFVHKQEKNRLVLKADLSINFENHIEINRSLSYIFSVYDVVSIGGWQWRPVSYKKDKLILKPFAPVNMAYEKNSS